MMLIPAVVAVTLAYINPSRVLLKPAVCRTGRFGGLPPTQSTSHVENGSPAEKKIQRPVQTTQIARNGIVYATEEHLLSAKTSARSSISNSAA